MSEPCRILLIDENDDYLDSLTDWLEGSRRVLVVGRAHSRNEAVGRINQLRPDLVLLDVSLPDGSGFELTRMLKSASDAPLVMLMSFHDGATVRLEADAAGADGWIRKTDGFRELKAVIDELHRNRSDNLINNAARTLAPAPTAEDIGETHIDAVSPSRPSTD